MKILSLVLGVLLGIAWPAHAQLIPYPSTSPLYSQPSTADPGELRLPEAAANGTNYTAIKAPASITQNVTFTWPGSLPTSTGCFTSDTVGVLTIESCTFAQTDTYNWTGPHTFTNSAGVILKPHGTSSGNTTALYFRELAVNGTNVVGFRAPDSIATNVTWTLPAADTSGCLKSDGSGTLSLTSCAPDISGNSYLTLGATADLSAERILTAGSGISFSDTGANGTLTVTNTGVTSAVAGTAISVSGATGAVTVTNTGVTSLTGTSNQVLVSGSTGAVTLSLTGPHNFTTLTGLALGTGTSALGAYGGTSCTNQFPRSLNASGVATCASVANADLTNSSITIQGSAVSLGGSALATTATPQFAALGLGGAAGTTDLKLYGSTSGSTVVKASAVAGTTTLTLPATTGTAVTTGDSGTVTNTMLAGSIAASKLVGTDIATVGTITTGTWTGTAIADGSIASALTGKTYTSSSQAAFTLNPFGAAAGNTGETRFLELAANGTSYVGFKAPDALAGNVIWTLPTADASGCLQSNGSGVFSLSACPGGGIAVGDNADWTGIHTWTNSAGPSLKPFGAAAGNTTELRFLELAANGTNYVGFKASDSLAGNVIWVLPTADSSGCFKSDGAGVMSLAACGGVATGDSPTWTGQHTFTAAGTGPKIRLSDTDSQILLGTTTDPGWAVPAVQLLRGAIWSPSATGGVSFTYNYYHDGSVARAIATDVSAKLVITSDQIYMYSNASATAGATITETEQFGLQTGITLGAPTGSFKGTGTGNFAGDVYKNGTAYNNPDYVLEHWATGQIVQFADRDGADRYQGVRSLSAVEAFTRQHYTLPLIHEARLVAPGGLGLFGGGDALLATVEEGYLYLFDHERRIRALESHVQSLQRKMKCLEAAGSC